MTGRYPMRYGLQTAVIPSGGLYGLAADERLLPEVLQDAGYQTSIVGKWHLGHADPSMWPGQRGFASSYGPLIGEIDHFTPLFMYLAFTAPHTPYQAPEDQLARYPGIFDGSRRAYAGQVSAMDDQIGRVVAALDAKGMLQDTLVVFHSDNGGTRNAAFTGESAVVGELPPDNGPYREGKGTNYEGGTRVVSLANWPGVLSPGKSEALIHVTDMLPTLAGLAGAGLDGNKPLDGQDVWPAIAGDASGPRTGLVYNIEPFRAAIRDGDWKLLWVPVLPPKVELFDLATDPGETTNLAGQHPEKVAELQAAISELSAQAAPPPFLLEIVRLGLTAEPAFPDGDFSFGTTD